MYVFDLKIRLCALGAALISILGFNDAHISDMHYGVQIWSSFGIHHFGSHIFTNSQHDVYIS